jgi:hypothetical protein
MPSYVWPLDKINYVEKYMKKLYYAWEIPPAAGKIKLCVDGKSPIWPLADVQQSLQGVKNYPGKRRGRGRGERTRNMMTINCTRSRTRGGGGGGGGWVLLFFLKL